MKTELSSTERAGQGRQIWIMVLAALLLGCQFESSDVEKSISAYRDRMLVQHQETALPPTDETPVRRRGGPLVQPVAAQSQLPARASLMTQPAATSQPSPADVLDEIPDPVDAPAVAARRLERIRQEEANRPDQRIVRATERVYQQANDYLAMLGRPQQMRLSLSECIQRAIENNYMIRIEAHNPAIAQTQVVEAEAAFDAAFFLDTSWAKRDQATASSFVPGTSDTRAISGGIRKLLPSGMQASVSTGLTRSKNNLPEQYQTLNPSYSTNFITELRQPLLRGFGLDVNRAQININRLSYEISQEAFVQQVRDTLLEVEQTYWQLAQARRRVVIFALSTAQYLVTYQNMVERLDHDATQVEVENSRSRWQSQYVSYLETLKLVRDAEDQLKNVLNDPALKLSDPVEIIPIETPYVAPTVVDHFAEVRTALDRRTEIIQARKRIDQSRISTAAAKNAILPQLDVSFQYEVQGLKDTADNSFDNLTTNRFISYSLGASFVYNFGERAARAAHRRARLQEQQAVVALNQVTDAIVQEVNLDIRTLMVRYDQLPPALESVKAAALNLRALQARTQRIDPSYLQTELSAVEQLASTRSTLLTVITDYNIGIVQLEKAKGTLLDYNNVAVSDVRSSK